MLKLRAARQRTKAKDGRCEGRKPFGHYAGEAELLSHIRELHSQGLNYEQLAKNLNANGFKSRSGRNWFPATVRRIVLAQ